VFAVAYLRSRRRQPLDAYNWETNASTASSDYIYNNDSYLSGSMSQPRRYAASLLRTKAKVWQVW